MLCKRFFFAFLSLTLVSQLGACVQKGAEGRVEWGGPDKVTNLVILFKKNVTHEQIEDFKEKVLSKPHPEGRGLDMQDGVAFQFRLQAAGYEGIGVNFSTDATLEQRERLKKKIRESQTIYKVLENVAPSDVKE